MHASALSFRQALPATVSLRLGHLRGLTVHRTVIQYPQAASLPPQGGLLSRLRYHKMEDYNSLPCAKGGVTEGDGGIVIGELNIALSLAYKRMIMFLSILSFGCVYRSSAMFIAPRMLYNPSTTSVVPLSLQLGHVLALALLTQFTTKTPLRYLCTREACLRLPPRGSCHRR